MARAGRTRACVLAYLMRAGRCPLAREKIIAVTLRASSSLIRQVDVIARRDGVTRQVVLRQAVASGLIAGPRPDFLRACVGDVPDDVS